MNLLRSNEFMDFLEHFPRAKRTFLVAEGAEDVVTSEIIFRSSDGKNLRPADYIEEFERFVKENPDEINAITILLDRSRDFGTRELHELRDRLASHPNRFTVKNLRKAYSNSLADIISIIRHAAKGDPLLTTEQRVDRALNGLRRGKTFTEEQEKWLALIRSHLIGGLVIDRADFGQIPFSRYGGWNKASIVFKSHNLEELLLRINVEMTT